MGFFSNLFGEQTCCICGSECGPMSRTKIKNKEFVCDMCARNGSLYARLSEMDKEFGVKFNLVSDKPGAHRAKESYNKNPHPHPYIHHEIKVCLTKDEKRSRDLDSILMTFDKRVFGTDDDRSRFFSMSKNEKANLQAGVDMANLIGSAIKAGKDGETDPEVLKEQFEKTQASTERANFGRLADYSRAADELFAKYDAI